MTADLPATDLQILRRMAAPPDRVWRAMTTPDLLCRWWTPHPVETVEAEIAPHPGGRFRTVMVVPDHGRQVLDFCILAADPGRRLIWTDLMSAGFRPHAAPMFGFAAEVTLTPDGTGTIYRARVMHRTPDGAAAHADMGFHDGWGTVAAQLDAFTATEMPDAG